MDAKSPEECLSCAATGSLIMSLTAAYVWHHARALPLPRQRSFVKATAVGMLLFAAGNLVQSVATFVSKTRPKQQS
jgi:hypothetical protein